jgi:hypothetical protein
VTMGSGLQYLRIFNCDSQSCFLAERAGFEPATRFYPCDGLANRCLRPLGHLSVFMFNELDSAAILGDRDTTMTGTVLDILRLPFCRISNDAMV